MTDKVETKGVASSHTRAVDASDTLAPKAGSLDRRDFLMAGAAGADRRRRLMTNPPLSFQSTAGDSSLTISSGSGRSSGRSRPKWTRNSFEVR